MTRQQKITDNLDHPCKDTCSGWKQGYDKGVLAGIALMLVSLGTFDDLKAWYETWSEEHYLDRDDSKVHELWGAYEQFMKLLKGDG